MKRLWVSGVLLVLLLWCCLAGNRTAYGAADALSGSLQQVKSLVSQENYETALAATQDLERQWQGYRWRLELFLPHDDLAAAEASLLRLPALLQSRELGMLQAGCDETAAQIQHLAESETLTWENLL